MKLGFIAVAALLVGTAFGATARGVVSEARAESRARLEYKVVGGSIGTDGYEQDLTRMTAEGWRYVGAIPLAAHNASLVFERSR